MLDAAALGPTGAVLVGARGTIVHYDGAAVTVMPPVTERDLVSVTVVSPTLAFAGGGNVVVRWDGTAWSIFDSPVASYVASIWASAADDVPELLHWDGTRWASAGAGPTHGYHVGMSGVGRFVAALSDETGLHTFDGTGWTEVPEPTGLQLYEVWTASARDVFLVGDAGAILRGRCD